MTTKNTETEICANCGKTKEEHFSYFGNKKGGKWCDDVNYTRQFTPQNHSPVKSEEAEQFHINSPSSGDATNPEIEDKILKEIFSGDGNECEVLERNGLLEEHKKAISLTLAECQKRNFDFIQKLKERILTTRKLNFNKDIWFDIDFEIDNLAKEFGIKQAVGK